MPGRSACWAINFETMATINAQGNAPILVTGAHRSGSTWVGQVLARASGLGYMHEPFNPIYPFPRPVAIDKWYLYIDAHNQDTYYPYFERLLRWDYQGMGRLAGVNSLFRAKMWAKYQAIFGLMRLRGARPVVKDPIAFFSASWLHARFGMPVVILVRHPAAFVHSLRRKDWNFPFEHLLVQKELMDGPLANWAEQIAEYAASRHDLLEQACLLWNILYDRAQRYREEYGSWHFLRHEDLSTDPRGQFGTLFQALGLDLDTRVGRYLDASSGPGNPSGTTGSEERKKRNSAQSSKYWKERMGQADVEKVKRLTEQVWPRYYTETEW